MKSISQAFADDHRRLEQKLEAAIAHARRGLFAAAVADFAAFRYGVERHMTVEEESLFPALEDGTETPLTAILRKGHCDLRVFFDELDDALKSDDVEECARIAASIRALLKHHDEKEEVELYPAAEARIGADAAAVVARLTG